jgi:hypothetical protein
MNGLFRDLDSVGHPFRVKLQPGFAQIDFFRFHESDNLLNNFNIRTTNV